jgi:hypothetical protein
VTDEPLSEPIEEMRDAAQQAARAAAGKVVGKVVGKRIAAAYPDLPPLVWTADDGWTWDEYHGGGNLMWHATAYVDTPTETRAIVAVYARAL